MSHHMLQKKGNIREISPTTIYIRNIIPRETLIYFEHNDTFILLITFSRILLLLSQGRR